MRISFIARIVLHFHDAGLTARRSLPALCPSQRLVKMAPPLLPIYEAPQCNIECVSPVRCAVFLIPVAKSFPISFRLLFKPLVLREKPKFLVHVPPAVALLGKRESYRD